MRFKSVSNQPNNSSGNFTSKTTVMSLGVFGVVIAIFIMMGVYALMFWANSSKDTAANWVSHTLKVEIKLKDILVKLVDAETGQRGYLLTGNTKYLEPFTSAVPHIEQLLLQIESFTKDNPLQQKLILEIRPLINAKVDELNNTVETWQSGEKDKAISVVKSDQGKQIMDSIRVIIMKMVGIEQKLLSYRQSELEALRTISINGQVVLLICLMLLVFVGYLRMRKLNNLQVIGVKNLIESNKQYDELNKDLDERVKIRTHELEIAVNELEAFSYSVSHDLRSPLRSIDGFSQAIIEDYYDKLDDTGRDFLERIRTAAGRMGELIDDLLNLSRISKREVKKSHVNLSEIVKSTCAGILNESDRDIEFSISEGIYVNGDEKLLRIVVENLIGNAVKYTRPCEVSKIQFGEMEIEGKGRVIYVRDNGVGFDMTYVDKLFVTFQRLHNMREFSGTGIGLSIVDRIIRKHGGSIWAEGKVNEGATFCFKI